MAVCEHRPPEDDEDNEQRADDDIGDGEPDDLVMRARRIGQDAGAVHGAIGEPQAKAHRDEGQHAQQSRQPKDRAGQLRAQTPDQAFELLFRQRAAQPLAEQPSVFVENGSRAVMDGKSPDEKQRDKEQRPVKPAMGEIGEKILRLQHQSQQGQAAKCAQQADAAGKKHPAEQREEPPYASKHGLAPMSEKIIHTIMGLLRKRDKNPARERVSRAKNSRPAELARIVGPGAEAGAHHIADDGADIFLLGAIIVGTGVVARHRQRPTPFARPQFL